MAIDSNIALTYKPIEVENSLTRAANYQNLLANKMKIDEVQRTQEEQNQLRTMLQSGADINSPEFLRQAFTKSPALGIQIGKYQAENAAAKAKVVTDKMKASKDALSLVTTPEEYLAWSKANHDDPVLGPELASKGISHDTAISKVQEALKVPNGFNQLLLQSQGGIEKALEYGLSVQKFNSEERHRKELEKIGWSNVSLAKQRLAKENSNADVSIDPETLDLMARYVKNGGAMNDVVGGMGKGAIEIKKALMRRIAEIDKESGISPSQGAEILQRNKQTTSATKKMRQDLAVGVTGRNINAINTADQHIDLLLKLSAAQKNGDSRAINQITNAVATQFGDPRAKNVDVTAAILAREIGKTMSSTAGSAREAEEAAKQFGHVNSLSQAIGLAKSTREIMKGKADAIRLQATSSGVPADEVEARFNPTLRKRQTAPTTIKSGTRTVKRTGTLNGRKVVEYTDGGIDYAN